METSGRPQGIARGAGAKTRAGGRCLVRVELGKARCRWRAIHRPNDRGGRARIAEAQRRRMAGLSRRMSQTGLAYVGRGAL